MQVTIFRRMFPRTLTLVLIVIEIPREFINL